MTEFDMNYEYDYDIFVGAMCCQRCCIIEISVNYSVSFPAKEDGDMG